jgi:hypothetical protein
VGDFDPATGGGFSSGHPGILSLKILWAGLAFSIKTSISGKLIVIRDLVH